MLIRVTVSENWTYSFFWFSYFSLDFRKESVNIFRGNQNRPDNALPLFNNDGLPKKSAPKVDRHIVERLCMKEILEGAFIDFFDILKRDMNYPNYSKKIDLDSCFCDPINKEATLKNQK